MLFIAYAIFVNNLFAFIIILTLIMAANQTTFSASQSLCKSLVHESQWIDLIALLRVCINSAISISGVFAFIALQHISKPLFITVLLFSSLTFFISAFLLWKLKVTEPPKIKSVTNQFQWKILDLLKHKLLLFIPLNCIMSLYLIVLNFGFPLWVSNSINISPEIIPILYSINSVLCIFFQVKAANYIKHHKKPYMILVYSGAAFAVSCICIGLAASGMQILFLAMGILLLTLGELFYCVLSSKLSLKISSSSASETLIITLFNSGLILAQIIGPVIMTSIVFPYHLNGWILLGMLFFASALIMTIASKDILTKSATTINSNQGDFTGETQ